MNPGTARRRTLLAAAGLLLSATGACALKPPNIIFILADDLGYGDLGCFHQDTKPAPRFDTPQIDALAADGIRLTHHYAASPVCAPSRASFLLGRHQGHCSLRANLLYVPLEDNLTLARMLKQCGYFTAHLGKYGIAGKKAAKTHPGHPNHRGFDYFLGYLFHGDPNEHYPRNGTTEVGAFVYENDRKIQDAWVDVYTPDLWTSRAKKLIVDETRRNPDRPFFLYLAYDTPHRKLQAPPAPYPAGGGLRGGLQWTGPPGYCNTATNESENIDAWFHPDIATENWPVNSKRHAAMVRRIDSGVGDLVQTLKELGIDRNTLIVFTSDNGPHSEGGQNPRFFESYGGMDGVKRDLWEAGIRVPTVAWWPGGIAPGTESAFPSGLWDWMPTFAELANAAPPAWSDGVSLVPTLTGNGRQRQRKHLYFEFKGPLSTPNWTEFELSRRNRPRGEMQAVRIGNFIGVRTEVATARDRFEIYDVVQDPKQTVNLDGSSDRFHRLQLDMQNFAMRSRRPNDQTARPYDSAALPPVGTPAQPGLNLSVFEGSWPWTPDFDALLASHTGVVENIEAIPGSGMAYTGYIHVPEEGSYTFFLQSGAGAILWIHDRRIIEDDYHHDGTVKSAAVKLKAGLHPIRLFARPAPARRNLTLQYQGPALPKQTVPDSAFFREDPAGARMLALDDSEAMRQGGSVEIDVIGNDFHQDGLSRLDIARVGDTGHGHVLVERGVVQYTPHKSFIGEDRFEYEITDGAETATAAVAVTVYSFDPNAIHLPFDESSGYVAAESGGRKLGALHAFADATLSWTEGRIGNALLFDGQFRRVALDPSYVPPIGEEDRTVSCWIKTLRGGVIAAWGAPKFRPHSKWHWRVDGGSNGTGALRLQVRDGNISGSMDLRDFQWHHVAIVFENSGESDIRDCRFYVDGRPDPIASSKPGKINTTLSPVQIGGDLNRPSFNGFIDDFRIYRRALGEKEIGEQFAAAPPG